MTGENAPEFHGRFSIRSPSVETCRAALMAMARGEDDEAEIEALSDWQAIQKVEALWRGTIALGKAMQSMTRDLSGATARFAQLGEALMPALGERLAEETELFLAIEHSG